MEQDKLQTFTPAEIAELALPAVVQISVASGSGTGFVVREDGRIATSLHLLAGAREATVVLADNRELHEVVVVAIDEQHDLALIQVPATGLPALRLGDTGAVRPGEHVIAVSHPLGFGPTVSDGLVSAVRQVSPVLRLLQLSAPLSPGSSGGPLFNDKGEVIGVARLIVNKGENLSFGMPVEPLKKMLELPAATPIEEWRWPGRIQRQVPRHELGLVADCAPEELSLVVDHIERAISIGAPLYNEGNAEACFRIYQATALELERKLGDCAGPKQALLEGVQRADRLAGYDEKAWAMRDTFDGLLDVIERYLEAASEAAPSIRLPAAPSRAVPHHPLGLLDGCSGANVHRIANAIAEAISVGAPLYNQGHFEACFRVYEGAVLDLERKLPGCAGAKRALAEGLAEAERRASFSDKAWALRDAFDGLLDLISRLPSTKN